ncbi:hypothetical protein [Saccharicrinis fermentans]|uniref:Lipoprotein n=1 Tax=Saccharicrinis fermentans DSM 9555 = JCM 21142 TaxID=869213 RepID=W7YSI3_9BACT|nr:hypothetical protein [Saccharicrinis fermentans]GAF05424.1 hypothetical protein JCM21142_104158 [Saccharicrinis fermentans DSM 9555 = JCM 21142]
MNSITKLSSLLILLGLYACQPTNNKNISFYHWKSEANSSDVIHTTLQQNHTSTIFMHYFDVEMYNNNVRPTYVLSKVDTLYKSYTIVPVVFITNKAIQEANVNTLSSRISQLIDQISQHHFNKTIKNIQIDCDWTQSTRAKYFSLIEKLQEHYEINVTIRLHQIKFQQKTGIPPVSRGTLMLYNVGDLKNIKQNSILEADIVKQYINSSSSYPLELDIALPLFSQTVIKNNNNQVRIINGTHKKEMDEASAYFKPLDTYLYQVKKDTLYKGFYLSNGYTIKLEHSNKDQIIAAYHVIKQSQINHKNIIFYHLDDNNLQSINSIIKEL